MNNWWRGGIWFVLRIQNYCLVQVSDGVETDKGREGLVKPTFLDFCFDLILIIRLISRGWFEQSNVCLDFFNKVWNYRLQKIKNKFVDRNRIVIKLRHMWGNVGESVKGKISWWQIHDGDYVAKRRGPSIWRQSWVLSSTMDRKLSSKNTESC